MGSDSSFSGKSGTQAQVTEEIKHPARKRTLFIATYVVSKTFAKSAQGEAAVSKAFT